MERDFFKRIIVENLRLSWNQNQDVIRKIENSLPSRALANKSQLRESAKRNLQMPNSRTSWLRVFSWFWDARLRLLKRALQPYRSQQLRLRYRCQDTGPPPYM